MKDALNQKKVNLNVYIKTKMQRFNYLLIRKMQTSSIDWFKKKRITVGDILAFQLWCSELSVKNQKGSDRKPNLIIFLVWRALILGGCAGM